VQKQKQGKKITMMQHIPANNNDTCEQTKNKQKLKRHQKDMKFPLPNKNKQIDKKCNVTSTYNKITKKYK
jgi:hypothetical protein